MGEAIKYGPIADPELFNAIGAKTIGMGDIIARCMKIKAKYVMEDEFEKGVRIHLNFGQTRLRTRGLQEHHDRKSL